MNQDTKVHESINSFPLGENGYPDCENPAPIQLDNFCLVVFLSRELGQTSNKQTLGGNPAQGQKAYRQKS